MHHTSDTFTSLYPQWFGEQRKHLKNNTKCTNSHTTSSLSLMLTYKWIIFHIFTKKSKGGIHVRSLHQSDLWQPGTKYMQSFIISIYLDSNFLLTRLHQYSWLQICMDPWRAWSIVQCLPCPGSKSWQGRRLHVDTTIRITGRSSLTK